MFEENHGKSQTLRHACTWYIWVGDEYVLFFPTTKQANLRFMLEKDDFFIKLIDRKKHPLKFCSRQVFGAENSARPREPCL